MAKIADIKWNDTGNGPGVNVSVFMQGCHFHCQGCFNPSTWNFTDGVDATDDKIKEIISGIGKSGIHRNLSILGGEPLNKENREFVAELLKRVRSLYPDIQIWLWTGYEWDELIAETKTDKFIPMIISYIDAMVVGRFHLEERDLTLRYMGSRNQRIIYTKDL